MATILIRLCVGLGLVASPQVLAADAAQHHHHHHRVVSHQRLRQPIVQGEVLDVSATKAATETRSLVQGLGSHTSVRDSDQQSSAEEARSAGAVEAAHGKDVPPDDPTVGWVDPSTEFERTSHQLQHQVAEANMRLVAAVRRCHNEGNVDCTNDVSVLQARGEVRVVRTVVHRVNALRAVAHELHREGVETQGAYHNATAALSTAKIALGVTQMERSTVDLKLETLHSIDKKWRVEMHTAAKTLLKHRKDREEAKKGLLRAEQRRMDFLVELNGVLEAVAGGNEAVDLTYEQAEETLQKANEREGYAKKMISQAETKLDEAYDRAKVRQQAPASPPLVMQKSPIVQRGGLSNFGSGGSDD